MKKADLILKWRTYWGITQELLAEKVGIDKRTITAWETGNATPRATNLKKIAGAWGLSYPDF